MARDEVPVSQSSNQTPSGPPPQGYPVPQADRDPPQGYPNHHDNPLSPPTPTKQDTYNVPDINMNTNNQQSTRSYVPDDQQPPPPPPQAYTSETYPPQQAPTAFPPQEQPTAYPPQEQPTAFPPQEQPPPFTNGASYNHQTYANSTPNHNAPPYYAPQQVPITGTPSIYQQSIQGWTSGLLECFDDPENGDLIYPFACV
nr:hypothetical protein [Tanacetum cinerariifolium]